MTECKTTSVSAANTTEAKLPEASQNFPSHYNLDAAAASTDEDRLYALATVPARVDGARDTYHCFLADAPGPKSTYGNLWLWYAALKAKAAGIPAEQAHGDIQSAMPHKPHSEVTRAVRRAYALGDEYHPPAPRIPRNEKAVPEPFWAECRRKYPETADPMEMLWESSPRRIDWDPTEDPLYLLRALYRPDEWLFIGDRNQPGIVGDTLRTAGEWYHYIRRGGVLGPFWLMNPLSGQPAPYAGGADGCTLRGDGCVASHRFVLCEFDGRTHDEQAAFWLNARLPVVAVIDSGGKSLHGWLRVDCADADAWQREIKDDLYPRLLEPFGADRQCKNAARLSRTPGVMRGDNWQRLLYLNPEAGKVAV